jgi:hypothetical protein
MIELLDRFNAFRNHVQFEFAPHQDDQLDCLAGAAVDQHFADQRAVDLQCLNRKLPQPAQGRNSGSEVIQDHAHPQLLQV